jgi:hypothetical protein
MPKSPPSPEHMPRQTAMLLTEEEWQDLAHMLELYVEEWADEPWPFPNVRRRLDLAYRIEEAAK